MASHHNNIYPVNQGIVERAFDISAYTFPHMHLHIVYWYYQRKELGGSRIAVG